LHLKLLFFAEKFNAKLLKSVAFCSVVAHATQLQTLQTLHYATLAKPCQRNVISSLRGI